MQNVIIPSYLNEKKIPNRNINELANISLIYSIHRFKEITSEILRDLYHRDDRQFWKVIHQLSFFGVQFTGSLVRFNAVTHDNSLFVWCNHENNQDVLQTRGCIIRINDVLKQNGIITKGDLHLVPLTSLVKEHGIEDEIIRQLEIQKLSFKTLNQLVKYGFNDINLEKSFYEANSNSIFYYHGNQTTFSKLHESLPLDPNLFYKTKDLIIKLNNLGFKAFNQLPKDLSFLSTLPQIGPKVVNKFFEQIDSINLLKDEFELSLKKQKFIAVDETHEIVAYDESFIVEDDFLDFSLAQLDNLDTEFQKLLDNHNFTTLKDLPTNLDYFYEKFKVGKRKIKQLFTLIRKNRPLSTLEKELADRLEQLKSSPVPPPFIEKREWDIFQFRYSGGAKKTLQAVGDKFGVSRERARQILRNFASDILTEYGNIIEMINEKLVVYRVISVSDVLDYSKEILETLDCVLDNLSGSFHIVDGQIITSYSKADFDLLKNIATRHIQNYLSENKCYLISKQLMQELVRNSLKEYQIEEAAYAFFINSIVEDDFILLEQGLFPKSLNKSEKCEYVLKTYFQFGIFIYKDIDQFSEKIKEIFPGVFDDDSSRSIIANLIRDSNRVILWDWGYYIHISNIDSRINIEVLKPVIDWLIEKFDTNLQLSSNVALLQFQEFLFTFGIENEHALYSCLKMHAAEHFEFPKCPKIFQKNSEFLTNIQLVEQFLIDKNSEIAYTDFLAEFVEIKGWKEYMIQNALANSPSILRSGDNQYVHIELLQINPEEFQNIFQYLKSKFSKDTPNISVRLLFNEKRPTLLSIGVDNDRLLYSLIEYYGNEEFDCNHYPYIQLRRNVEIIQDLTPKNIMEQYFLSASGSVFRDEVVNEFIHKRGWTQNTFYNVFATSENIVPLINQSEYIHVNKLDWNQEKSYELEQLMEHVWEKHIVSQGRIFGSLFQDIMESEYKNQLPSIGDYLWTEDLIIALIANSHIFRLLGTKKRLFVKIPNLNQIENTFDLIAFIIRTEYNGAAKLKTIEKRLAQIELITNYFPKSYEPTELYQIINGEIVLSDLLEGSSC